MFSKKSPFQKSQWYVGDLLRTIIMKSCSVVQKDNNGKWEYIYILDDVIEQDLKHPL